MEATHVIIEGLVQGVFFRDYTSRQALKLHLTGWVRNLPDCTVETMFSGDKENIISMLAWLKQGSPLSKVENITTRKINITEKHSSFEVRF